MAKGVAKAVVDVGPAPAAGLGRSLSGRHLHYREKGGSAVGKTRRGKGTKCMVVVDGNGIPVGAQLASAQLAECRLAESTLAAVKVPRQGRGRPRSHLKRIIADRGYDSDALRTRFKTLENRTHQRLVAKLPPHPGALRPHPHRVSGLLSFRLPDHRLEAFMQPALVSRLTSEERQKILAADAQLLLASLVSPRRRPQIDHALHLLHEPRCSVVAHV